MSAAEDDGWNPLLNLEECGRTFREAALSLKWQGRVPDLRDVAEAVHGIARLAILTKDPEQWARKALSADLPPRKRGRKAAAHHEDVKCLATLLRPYCDSEREARAVAQVRLSRPWDSGVVRELVSLVRESAANREQALRWVGAFLHLSEDRVRSLYYRMPDAERRWTDADGAPIDPDTLTLD